MDVFELKNMIGGWFCGAFKPTAFYTYRFEVAYVKHFKGQKWPRHFHKKSDEINLLVKGRMKICGRKLKAGDIFVIRRLEVADPVFLTDCEVVVIKTSSVKGDKYVI